MNERTKLKITEKLRKIETGKFLTDDIEILLINIREFARTNNFSLLLEFCDFVAHSKRSKGLVYDEIDVLYSKLKYMVTTPPYDHMDYNKIPKKLFELLFEKGIDQMSDNYLIDNLGKTSNELKGYLKDDIFLKDGSFYKIKNQEKISEVRKIRNVCSKVPPHIHILSEDSLIEEIKICISNLSKQINCDVDLNKITSNKYNLMLCLLEIIQNCKFELHDGKEAKGFIAVNSNNNLYESNPIIENLNLSFNAEMPVQQSFVLFDLIQTGITIGKNIPNPNSVIEWTNKEHTSGKLKLFKVDILRRN